MSDRNRSNEQLNTATAMSAEEHRRLAEMHKDAVKAQWKLFLKTGAFVIALVVIFFLAIAWFVNTKQNEGNGMAVRSDKPKLAVTGVTAFSYSKELEENPDAPGTNQTVYKFTRTDQMDSMDGLTMSYYDGITEENEKTPVILMCRLTGQEIEKDQTVTFYFDNTFEDDWKNANDFLNRYLSNITNVRCAYIPDTVIPETLLNDTTAGENIWRVATHYMTNNAEKRTFVTLPDTKQKTLTFQFAGDEYDLTSDRSAYFFFMIDYEKDLVLEYVKGNSLTADIGRGQVRIDFDNDFEGIRVDVQ